VPTLELIAHAMRTMDEESWRELRRRADAGDDVAYFAICAEDIALVMFMRTQGFNFAQPTAFRIMRDGSNDDRRSLMHAMVKDAHHPQINDGCDCLRDYVEEVLEAGYGSRTPAVHN
jgi:hypothetical protein